MIDDGRMFQGDQRCDFCVPAQQARWDYPATSFVYRPEGLPMFGSDGGWLACQRCADLIEANDLDGLVAVSSLALANVSDQRRGLLAMFMTHRTGERVPFG